MRKWKKRQQHSQAVNNIQLIKDGTDETWNMKHSREDAEKKQDKVPQSKRLTDKAKMPKPVNKKIRQQ